MKKEITVIVPCYNTSLYIEKCLDSALKQLAGFDYEIIVIDDASVDGTADIVEEYISKTNENILLVKNEKNIGAGASRNKAVKLAKYDYISFIDSDDYLEDGFFEELYKTITDEGSDLVVCDIVMVDNEKKEETLCKGCDFIPTKYNLIANSLAASPCNKLIKKKYLLEYPFAEGIINEDVTSIIAIIANCKKVSYTSKTRYYYLQRNSSVQNSPITDKRLDIIEAVGILDNRIKNNPEYTAFMRVVIYNQIICLLLYVPQKEKSVFKRARFLREFNKLSKKYKIRKNELFWNFLSQNSPRMRLYYKAYMKLLCNGFSLSASALISFEKLYRKIFSERSIIKKKITKNDLIKEIVKNSKKTARKSVSVAIPNYNYADFLYQRLYSVFYQNYRISELILLDDCSTDNSRALIDDLVEDIAAYVKIKKAYNAENSGSPFKQWKKAFELAESEYIWIAEADDYCDKKMLSSIMKYVEEDNDITVAYVDTAFINKTGSIVLKTIKPEIDIQKTGHWDHSFVNDGIDEIKRYAFLNCTIANVSSAIFKKDNYSDIFEEMGHYRQVGDYLFYLSVMERGKVAYIDKAFNYYRLHGNNVTSTTKKQQHFDELKQVHNRLENKLVFTSAQKAALEKRYEFLRRVWELDKGDNQRINFLVDDIHIASVTAKTNENGILTEPVILVEYTKSGIFFLLQQNDPLCTAIEHKGEITISGIKKLDCETYFAVLLYCFAENVGNRYVLPMLSKHSYLKDLYPTENDIRELTVIRVEKGTGVWVECSENTNKKEPFVFETIEQPEEFSKTK